MPRKRLQGCHSQDGKVQHWEEISPRDPLSGSAVPGNAAFKECAHWDKLAINSFSKGLATDKHSGRMVSDCSCQTTADVKCSSSERKRSVTCVFALC